MHSEHIESLHHLILHSTTNDAVSYLDRLDWLIELHKIYQHFFPEAYALDNCDWMINESSVSSWEINLFKLIDDNLFSLPESLVEGEELLSIIPIYPIYPDWWNSELEDLPKTFQLVLFISGNIELSFFQETPDWLKPELSRIIGGCDFLKLEALCKQAKAPLTVLPKVMESLDHRTGNPWLDSTDEAYLEFDWTVDNIEMLRAHWLECQAIYSEIAELDDWLEDKKNIVSFCQIFYECDSEPHDPETLMTVLADYL